MATILVVEDDHDIRELVRLALETAGHTVVEASSGEEAIQQALQRPPDLILMDISLPGQTDGITATRHLRAQSATADTPIIALTAHAMRGDRERAEGVGFTHYWTKPILDLEGFTVDVAEVLAAR